MVNLRCRNFEPCMSALGQEPTLPQRTNHADLACCVTVTGNVKENVEP